MVTYKRHICFHYYKVVLEEDRNGEWVNVGDFNIADWPDPPKFSPQT